jgi:hypothetical protein
MNHSTTTKRHDIRTDLRDQILTVLKEKGPQVLDDLVHHCPAATWNRVFLEVDRLSRKGEVKLVPARRGVHYEVRLPADEGPVAH